MNIFKKALIVSVALLIFHLACIFLYFLTGMSIVESAKTVFRILVYAFFYSGWAYYLISLFYLLITRSIPGIYLKIIIALLWMTLGYFMFRGGDIIDGDFMSNFHWVPPIVFFLSAFFLVGVDLLLNTRSQRKIKGE